MKSNHIAVGNSSHDHIPARHIDAPNYLPNTTNTRGIPPLPNYGIQVNDDQSPSQYEDESPADYIYGEETSEEILEQGSDVLTNFTQCQPGMPGY